MKKGQIYVVAFLVMLLLPGVHAKAQSDSELIMSLIRNKIKPSNLSLVENVVASYLPTIQSDGSWADINYSDVSTTNGWEPKQHNDRLFAFAQAYVLNSTYKGSVELFSAIEKGLDYYYQVNPTTTHWWSLEIQAPQTILGTLIYLREGMSGINKTLETNILKRFDLLPEPTKHGIGANRSDVALWHLYQALLRDNPTQLAYASEHLFNSFVTTTGNGIQHDYSYMDHGPQLYTYGYGVVLVNNTNKAAGYLVGTPYAMPAQYLDVYSEFLKKGYSSCLRGKYVSYSTLGRSISRPDQVRKYAGAFSEAITIDPANAPFYQTLLDRSKGTVNIGHGVAPTNTHYYRSKFTTHNREGYYFTVLTASNRTEKTEQGNGENLKGLFLADGATNFMVNGDEYYNIFPVWDWTKIPGVTAPELANTIPAGTWGTPGTSTFTGGVSNGVYGAHMLAMNDYNMQVKKAWFCFDDEVVCLGAGMTSAAAERVNTTVNQCLLDGAVTVSQNGVSSTVVQGSANTYSGNLDWALHDNIGYFFPAGGNLKLSNQTQTGSWSAINNTKSSAQVSADVFKLYFDHGTQAQNDSYAYIVVPGKSSVAEMQNYNSNNIQILSNTNDIQAVHHQSLDMIQVVFYKAGLLNTNGITIQADKPCVMVLSNVSSPTVNVSMADPGETSSVIKVGFESPQITGMRQLTCTMPTNIEAAGQSVDGMIDANTPAAVANNDIIAIEDAYVRGGSYANSNYPGGDLVCKKVADEAYVRSVFVKFDVSSLAGQHGTAKVRLNLSNAGVNTFSAYYVTNDNWTETTLTWANMPATTTHLGNVTNDASGVVEWDISSQLMSELSSDQTITIKIEALVDQVYSTFYSRDAALQSLKPAIVFTPVVSQVSVQHDAYVRGGSYGNNSYNMSYLVTKLTPDEAYTREIYLKFDVSDFDSQAGKYTLKLAVTSGNTNTWKIGFSADDNWTESMLTWNNKPVTSSLVGTFTNTTSLLEVDITDWVMTELSGDKQLTLKVESTVDQVYAAFASKEDADISKHPVIYYESELKKETLPTALEEFNHLNNSIVIYPNPASDLVYLRNVAEVTSVAVYTITGQLVKTENYQSGIVISGLAPGLYVVIIHIDGKQKSLKLEKR